MKHLTREPSPFLPERRKETSPLFLPCGKYPLACSWVALLCRCDLRGRRSAWCSRGGGVYAPASPWCSWVAAVTLVGYALEPPVSNQQQPTTTNHHPTTTNHQPPTNQPPIARSMVKLLTCGVIRSYNCYCLLLWLLWLLLHKHCA